MTESQEPTASSRSASRNTSYIGSGAASYRWEHPNPWVQLFDYAKQAFGDKTDNFITAMEQNAKSLEDFLDFAFVKANGGFLKGNFSVDGTLSVNGVALPQITTGMIIMYGSDVAPSGWVNCDGAVYNGNNSTYNALSNILGTTYATVGGQTAPTPPNFRVPDLRGRAPLGYQPTTFPMGGYAELTDVASNDKPGYVVVNFIIKL